MKEIVGVGEDGEKVWMEVVHLACVLVHCEGNTESPFEFSSEYDASEFMRAIGGSRMRCRLEEIEDGN